MMGFGDTMAKLLLRKKPPETDAEIEAKKAKLEEANKVLPEAVSARPAILKKREQMKQIDKILEDR